MPTSGKIAFLVALTCLCAGVLSGCSEDIASRSAEERPIPLVLPETQRESFRKLPIEGTDNFRDLGGYRTKDGRVVRWGLAYRSDDLSGLTDEDQRYLKRLGLKRIVDFRSDTEIAQSPDRLGNDLQPLLLPMPIAVEGAAVQKIAEKFNSGTMTAKESEQLLIAANRSFIQDYTNYYSEWLHLLIDDANTPIVFHCTAGKDRTGLAAALLLLALGVDKQTVIEDYMATNQYTESATQFKLRMISIRSLFQVDADALKPVFVVKPHYLGEAFKTIEENYGSFDAYLREGLKISEGEQQQLIHKFTTQPSLSF